MIDALDENWAEDPLRYRLIRALLEAIRNFRKVRQVKIVIALRTDLLHSVLTKTTETGFQGEKIDSMLIRMQWTREQLASLLDRRVTFLYRRQYSQGPVGIRDILVNNQVNQRTTLDYILDRTLMRPRDAILFVNECIKQAQGRERISVDNIRQAEQSYSRRRLESLADEWRSVYPGLNTYCDLLKHRTTPIRLTEFADQDCYDLSCKIVDGGDDPAREAAERYLQGQIDNHRFLQVPLKALYQAGLISVKMDPAEPRIWSYEDTPALTTDIPNTGSIEVHKMFWAALAVTTPHQKGR